MTTALGSHAITVVQVLARQSIGCAELAGPRIKRSAKLFLLAREPVELALLCPIALQSLTDDRRERPIGLRRAPSGIAVGRVVE